MLFHKITLKKNPSTAYYVMPEEDMLSGALKENVIEERETNSQKGRGTKERRLYMKGNL